MAPEASAPADQPGAAKIELVRWLSKPRNMKELQDELGITREYLQAMKHHGFKMPGGRASIRMARKFLETCESFQLSQRED